MKVAGIMIGTSDSKKLADFYREVFSEAAWNQGDWYGFGSMEQALVIGPHSEVKGQNSEPQRLMINIVTDDVQAEFDRIIEATNAQVIAEPYRPEDATNDGQLATLADPDGNYFQLSTSWKM